MKDEIIDLVLNTPAVWDKSHKHHHNRHVLAKEWKKIAAKLGAAEIEVRRCWKNLRQEFGKQLRKSEYQLGDAVSDDIQWPYFQKLLFLQDQFTPRKTDSTFTDTPDELSTLSTKNTDDSDSELYSDDDNCMLPADYLIQNVMSTPPSDLDHVSSRASTSMNPPTLSPSHGATRSRATIQKPTFKKRKLIDFDKDMPAPPTQKERPVAIDYHIDEDVGFFNSILPHVRNLPPRDKFIFRMKVQQMLFELAFPQHESSQQRTSFPSSRQTNCASAGEVYPGASHLYEYYKSETEMSD